MARRPRGDGSVFYDSARGCWVGSVDIGRDPETGRRRRRKVSAPTRTECRDKLAEVRWVSLAELDGLMGAGNIFAPVHEHLAREIGEG